MDLDHKGFSLKQKHMLDMVIFMFYTYTSLHEIFFMHLKFIYFKDRHVTHIGILFVNTENKNISYNLNFCHLISSKVIELTKKSILPLQRGGTKGAGQEHLNPHELPVQ